MRRKESMSAKYLLKRARRRSACKSWRWVKENSRRSVTSVACPARVGTAVRGESSEGELKDGVIEFKSDEYSSTVKDGVLTISVAGVKISELKKVDRESRTLGDPPPEGAVVLFDGSTASNFENGKMTEDGLLLPGCTSKEKFGSGKLHVEFRLPFMPECTRPGTRQQRRLCARTL